jgi:hypothetical protein
MNTGGVAMSYKKLSQEEIDAAAKTNLIDFLLRRGEPLKKSGSSYRWVGGGNESVTIIPHAPHLFKHFATGQSGNAITFCMNKLGMSFSEAVISLNEINFIAPFPKKEAAASFYNKVKVYDKPTFMPPAKKEGAGEVYDYLVGRRGIAASVAKHFIQKGDIYQVKDSKNPKHNNIAFLYNDFNKSPAGAIKRGIPPNDFKGNHKGSDMNYCFRYCAIEQRQAQNPLDIFVFEAPTDMLSYISNIANQGKNWKQSSYLATGGIYPKALINYINYHYADKGRLSEIRNIFLCHDNDPAGINARINTIEALESLGYKGKIILHFPENKDWNDDLICGIISKRGLKAAAGNYEILTKYLQDLKKALEVDLEQDLEADYKKNPANPSADPKIQPLELYKPNIRM